MQLMIRNMCNGQRWSHTHYFPPTGKSSGCILPTSHSGRRQTKRVQHNFDQNLKVQTDQTCHHVTDRPPHWLLMANAHTSTLILHYTPIQGPDGISFPSTSFPHLPDTSQLSTALLSMKTTKRSLAMIPSAGSVVLPTSTTRASSSKIMVLCLPG